MPAQTASSTGATQLANSKTSDTDLVVAATPYGGLLLPAEDTQLVAAMLGGDGVLEPGTTRLLTMWLAPGDTMIDVGANIGLLTIPAALCVGPLGQVIACEPLSRLADILARNLALRNVADRVHIMQAACGAQGGTARLNVGKVLGHSSLLALDTSVRTEDVSVVRLDDAIEPGTHISLVKIDAEGFELQVWRGMQRVIADNPDIALIVEFGPNHLARAGVTVADWLAAFQSGGFACYEIDEHTGRPMILRASGLEEVVSINMLFIRNKRRMQELFGDI